MTKKIEHQYNISNTQAKLLLCLLQHKLMTNKPTLNDLGIVVGKNREHVRQNLFKLALKLHRYINVDEEKTAAELYKSIRENMR